MALTSTGAIYDWGENLNGDLGNGTSSNNLDPAPAPVRVSLPPGIVATAIASSDDVNFALTSTGVVYGWGYGGADGLGNGTTTSSDVPEKVGLPAGVVATAISAEAGLTEVMALTATGTVYAWGLNLNGVLGNGTTTGSSDVPVQVSLPAGIVATGIASGGLGGMALTSTGAVYDWGTGVLGNGTNATDISIPVKVSLPLGVTATAIAATGPGGMALTSTGAVYDWGSNYVGELGDGVSTGPDTCGVGRDSFPCSTTPVLVSFSPAQNVTSIGGGGGFALAIVGQSSPPPVTSPIPVTSPNTSLHGYWLVGSDGGIFTFGSAQFDGSTGSLRLQRPVVGIVPTKDDGGYWLDASDGGVFSFGDTQFYGSIPGLGLHPAGSGLSKSLNAPIVGMVPSIDDGGYFMVASDGGIFAFGDAHFAGSCPGIGGCSGAAVAVMPDASGNGYWLVTKSGSVYTFGDAPYFGAPGHGTVTSAVATPDGKGYWILLSDGEVFPYGNAANLGSPSSANFPGFDGATAIFATSDGAGYWVSSALGAVSNFGDAPNDGDVSGTHLNGSIIAATGF
jgi:hypothetical protein